MANDQGGQDRRERTAWRLVLAVVSVAMGLLILANPARVRQRLEAETQHTILEFATTALEYARKVDVESAPDARQATPLSASTPAPRDHDIIGVVERVLSLDYWLAEAKGTPEPTPSLTPSPTTAPLVQFPPTAAPTPLQLFSVTPILLKVQDNGDGTRTAVFSYENPNRCAVTIAVGGQNYISPEPADRGQETTFHPTNKLSAPPRAFAVVFKEDSITWTLMGRSVVADVFE